MAKEDKPTLVSDMMDATPVFNRLGEVGAFASKSVVARSRSQPITRSISGSTVFSRLGLQGASRGPESFRPIGKKTHV